MAESMQGLHRSHRCTEVNNTMVGNTVTVMGAEEPEQRWNHLRRSA